MTTKQNCRVKSSQGDTKEVSRFHQHFVPHEESSHGESCHYDFWKALRHHDKEQGRGGRGCPRWHGLPVSVARIARLWRGLSRRSLSGIRINSEDIDAAIIETHDLLSEKLFTHASPTLFNVATPRPQLCSCFLNSLPWLGNLRFYA